MVNVEGIHIGTSGWHYDHWKGPFYPREMDSEGMLGYYSAIFRTVEVNNTFYQLPEKKTLLQWRDAVPAGFIFAVKASRYITHMKKLRDPEDPVSTFMQRIETLGVKLGPILFQLPPRWKLNPERLKSFLQGLPEESRYVFEFRDPSWFDEVAYGLLSERNIALCIYELAGFSSPKRITADFAYLRLHGPGEAYEGKYDRKALAEWARTFFTWSGKDMEIFCYFDNDERGYAAANATQLSGMLFD